MSDLVKILVTVLLGAGLIYLAYNYYSSSRANSDTNTGQFTPQYGPVYMPQMR